MCDGGDEGSSGSGAAGGATGGIGFSDVSGIGARDQASGKSAASEATSEGEEARTKASKKKGEAIGTIVGLLSPVPGGSVIGGALGSFIAGQAGGVKAGSGSAGEGGLGGAGGGEGGEREMTSFPSREAAATTVLASEQDKRRALRGRKATILTSPRGVTTEAPGRKTLLGE